MCWTTAQRRAASANLDGDPVSRLLLSCAIAAAAVAALFTFQGREGFSLADESHLWYGVQRVLLGEVPIRDFMAYDPGRYYWSAALMSLFGDNGIISVRVSVAVFQAIGLALAMLLLLRANPRASLIFYLLAGVTLLLWMFPRHKLFDITVAIGLMAALAYLIERPTLKRCFLTGLIVGAAAIFGRNHGVYGLAGSLAALGILTWKRAGPSITNALPAFAAGVLIGFAPILITCLLVPGFYQAFFDDVLVLFEIGRTNLTIPVPWPWKAIGLTWPDALQQVLLGSFFVMVLIFAIVGPGYVLLSAPSPTNATFAAAAFLALPYAHFAFARADTAHLAQGIFPMLVGLMTAPCIRSSGQRVALAALLLAASLPVTLPMHPGWVAWRSGTWKTVQVGRDQLEVSPGTAANVHLLTELVDRYAPNGEAILSVPYWVAPYAMFNRKAPIWEVYPLVSRSAVFQQAEIERIRTADPALVILDNAALDGLDERRYRSTHPLMYDYIVENFERVSDRQFSPDVEIYVPRQANTHR